MISLKARFFTALLRNRHLFKGKLKKEKFDLNTSIIDFRDECEKGAAMFGKLPKGIIQVCEEISGIKSEWLIPESAPNEKTHFLYSRRGDMFQDHAAIIG